jgi:NAD(P)H-dependent flavin oxidoreductase YrpB (nitropropane dioxygenase family)
MMSTGTALHTALCDLLGIEYPIILAGMGGAAGPTLAAAVSNAGGLGVVGATGYTPDELREMIRKVRSLTDKPFGIDLLLPSNIAESGGREQFAATLPQEHVEFVKGLRDRFGVPEPTPPRHQRPPLTAQYYRKQVRVVLEEHVPVFASGLGSPAFMVPEAHAQGMKVIGLAGNLKHARRVAEGGCDAVVAQGTEAGGHTGQISTLVLVPQIVEGVAPTPVIAAGGIATGAQLVAMLALGAVGVWCGTAFLLAEEAYQDAVEMEMQTAWYVRTLKEKYRRAEPQDAKVGRWYSGKPMRHLRNPWSDAWEEPDAPGALPMPLQGLLVGDAMRSVSQHRIESLVYGPVGQAVGLLDEIRPAREIVTEMVREAEEVIASRFGAGAVTAGG